MIFTPFIRTNIAGIVYIGSRKETYVKCGTQWRGLCVRKGRAKKYRGMRVRERRTNSNGEQGEIRLLNVSQDCGFRVFAPTNENNQGGV